MTDRDTYYKIRAKTEDNARSQLHQEIGACDQTAGEVDDPQHSPEDYQEAYNRLRSALDEYLNDIQQAQQLHFE